MPGKQGDWAKDRFVENQQTIRHHMTFYLGIKNTEIAEKTGLSVFTVGRHVKIIRDEWLCK